MSLMRIVLAYVSLATLALAADLPWSKMGTCFTPQGTLCRTIEYEVTTWAFPGYGFNRLTGREVFAYRSDGAMYESHFGQRFRYFLIPQPWVDRTWFVLPASQQTTDLYSDSKEYVVRSGARGGYTIWKSDDPDCSKYAKAFALFNLRRGGDEIIAGLPTVKYMGQRASNEVQAGGSRAGEESINLAPSVGCTQMRRTWYVKNGIGVAVEAGRTEVTSFKIGEPDSHYFEIPPGYHPRAHR
jgi:hypothetical protein